MKKKSTAQSAPARQMHGKSGSARHRLSTRRSLARRLVDEGGFFNLRLSITFLMCTAATCSVLAGVLLAVFHPDGQMNVAHRTLTFAERVAYQRAIEEVYWRHRIWTKENSKPKPSLDQVMSQAQLENKVEDYLRKSQAVENYYQQPITAEQLQAEMDRMAKHTKQPEVLRELFEALGNNPFVIAECLARPVLAERFVGDFSRTGKSPSFRAESRNPSTRLMGNSTGSFDSAQDDIAVNPGNAAYRLPQIFGGSCTGDTWTAITTTNAPSARAGHTAIWTGSEMIVWGGDDGTNHWNTGGKYNPSTDSWTATNTTNAPSPRTAHTAIWTGSEMIVWGGVSATRLNTGGRYNPATDTWSVINTVNAPDARSSHTAIWTGSEMIIWGGDSGFFFLDTGGKYNPNTDSWTATSTANAPIGRAFHTAVWTGSEMIVWGGYTKFQWLNSGGRYNPGTNSWTATTLTNAPTARYFHTAVWDGIQMTVWGGNDNTNSFNTGGKYRPVADSWTATSVTNAPAARYAHTAVLAGNEMIVWGGTNNSAYFNTGGRYNFATDSWIATSITNAPSNRAYHTATLTGSEMIVWGGYDGRYFNTGGKYCAQPAPSPTATATATSTPRVTPTPRRAPTPRAPPSPAPRP